MSENQITQALLVALIKELIESKTISGDRTDDVIQSLSMSAKG